ncbi:MAG: biosynthetic-type acetolactate synthase large subunit [Bacteroidales bacterium]|nr:biosynthetic-type acetolactate synthase large subunit [Bacteroidales bacterium]
MKTNEEKTAGKELPAEGTVITGSEALIFSLLKENADTIFGYPGGAIMPVYDALFDYRDQLNHVLVRHEQGAAHAAESYAKILGKTGVVLVTSGPGATNLVTGLANAMIDSVPMVAFSGQVSSNLLGTDAFQETDVIGITMPVTKWNYQITSAEEIPEIVAKAFYIASTGRPGPVMIDITKDAQFGKIKWHYEKCRRIRSYFPYPKVQMDKVEKAAHLINKAQKPLLIAGRGILISKAEEELMNLVTKADIPVTTTLLGLSSFPVDHPLNVGMPGMHGNMAPNIKTNECDLLIAIGMRFDDRITGRLDDYANQAKIIHIEIDHSEIGKNVTSDVAIVADAKDALSRLLPLVKENDHKEWVESFRKEYKKEYEKVIKPARESKGLDIKMDEVVHLISDKTDGQAIVVTDVGQHQMVVARNYCFKQARSFVTSGGLGTMGFGLPAAVGAKVARPDRVVLGFAGDGGFQMTIQELGTIAQHKLPVKMILLNNSFLGMVRQWQDMFFDKRYSFTELANPAFTKIASEGYGIASRYIEKREDLEKAVDEMLDTEGPFLLEVKVMKEQNVFPMVPAGASVSHMVTE